MVRASAALAFATNTSRLGKLCFEAMPWQVIYLLLCSAVGANTRHFVIVPQSDYPEIAGALRDGCKKAETELGGEIACDVITADGDVAKQERLIEDSVARGADGIAVFPVGTGGLVSALKQAKDAGIPVTFGSDLPPAEREARAAFVGPDNREVGDELAKLLFLIKPKGGKYCIQTGATAPSNQERLKAIHDALAPAKEWVEVSGCPLSAPVEADNAAKQMNEFLAKYPELDAFISTNGAPQFAPEAYRKAILPFQKRIMTGGFGLLAGSVLPQQLALLKQGLSSGQVGTNYFEMGYKIALLLNDIKQGRKPPDSTLIRPAVAVYRDAVQDSNKCPPPDGTHDCHDGTCASTCSGQ
jgi:ribose transport system substrate-binding protein